VIKEYIRMQEENIGGRKGVCRTEKGRSCGEDKISIRGVA
jgi:hypothetical protein